MNKSEKKHNFRRLSVLFITGGIFSGIIALAISAILPLSFTTSKTISSLVVLVVIEEAAKFLIIYGILKSYSLYHSFGAIHYFVYPAMVGFGFGLFELLIITMGATVPTAEMLRPMLIHLITSLIFGVGFYWAYKSKSITILTSFFLLSMAIHIWYNVMVLADVF